MAFSERSLDDYVDVAQRIADFRALHPQGSLQPADPASPWEVATVTGYDKNGEPLTQSFIVYAAAAYRTPDDERPGIGVAWEVFPGRTPYTRGSELQNCETSAWGRAIVAVLASDSKAGVASRQEVKARRAEREDGLPVNADGSLSRSRTSDADKDAAGVMTAAQLKEHTTLQPKRQELRPVEHLHPCDCESCRTSAYGPHMLRRDQQEGDHPDGPPPDEVWANGENDPEHRPGTLTPAQQRTIHAAFPKNVDRAERLAYISGLAGRDVTSTNDLSYAEAQLVVAGLGREPVKQ